MINRRFIHCLLTSLFVLFPAVLPAQQLSSWEYWFDDDKDSKTGFAISGDERSISTDISTEGLEPGVHQLHIRVAQRGGEYAYSPISTTTFFKRPAGSGRQLEYWFDGDYKNRQSYSLDADGEVESLTFDMTSLSPGLHQVNIRVASPGQAFSAVYSAVVLKVSSGNVDKLEYWVDDNYLGKKTIDVYQGNDVMAHFIKDLDLSHLPMGVYRLNYRAYSSTGSAATAVGSVPVIVSTGTTPKVEYWIDDDFKHSKMLEGKAVSGGYHFSQDVDLNGVSAGAHRLNYRIVMADGKAKGAVSSTPFIAHSRYDGDGSDAVLTSYSIAVDDQEPVSYDMIGTPYLQDITHIVDASSLKAGSHTVTAKVWNSLGTSVAESAAFTVPERLAPTLTLNAIENEGIVTLTLSAVANDESYHITRVDATGAQRRICRKPRVYPADIIYVDEPAEGQYEYYAECVYRDANGVRQSLRSANVSVSVASQQGASTQQTGYITGYALTTNGNPLYGETHNTWNPASVRIEKDGVFLRHTYFDASRFGTLDFPVGTVLTLSVDNDDFNEIEPVTVTIEEGNNEVVLTGVPKELLQPNNMLFDLSLVSNVDMQGGYLVFSVKNRSNRPWSGTLRFKAINDSNYKKLLKGTLKGGTTAGDGDAAVLAGSVAPTPQTERIWFYSTTEERVSISGKMPKKVMIPLSNVFPDNKRDYYHFYLESSGRWTDGAETEDEVKSLAIPTADYNVTAFPFERQIDKSSLANALDLQEMQNAEYAANFILAMCCTIKGLDGQIGDLKKYCEDLAAKDKKFSESLNLLKLRDHIDEMTVDEMLADPVLNRIMSQIMNCSTIELINKFRDNVVADLVVNISKGVDAYLKPAMNALKTIRDYEELNASSEYDKVFYCADKVIELAGKKIGAPFTSILETYMHVTKSFAQAALAIGEKNYQYTSGMMLRDNIPLTDDDKEKYKYNRYIDFKIMVSPNWSDDYFNFDKRKPGSLTMIRDAVVKVIDKDSNDENDIATVFLEPVAVDDGLMLKQVGFLNGPNNGELGHGALDVGKPFKRMWMEITWKNGRKSTVPLMSAGKGVEFEQPIFEVFGGRNTYQYTIKFESGATWQHFENLADILTLEN